LVSGQKKIIQRTGAPSGNGGSVVDGTETTTIYEASGEWESEEVVDIASNRKRPV